MGYRRHVLEQHSMSGLLTRSASFGSAVFVSHMQEHFFPHSALRQCRGNFKRTEKSAFSSDRNCIDQIDEVS